MMVSSWGIDSSWCLFLDRDGVINERIWDGYVLKYDQFIFREGTLEALSKFKSTFKYIFVVTNQQCVGKGIITFDQLNDIHTNMKNQIIQNEGIITDIFIATELKNEPPHRRKPSIKMGLEAKKKYTEIDFSKSIMIGDTDSDIKFGKNLGMKTVRIKSMEKEDILADVSVTDLENFVQLLMN
jgi:D-glycero-D-manno-heptose 1,7-bisphosphate phosphatase